MIPQESEKDREDSLELTNEENEEVFEPVLGELVADDAFSFTLLSCHC